jgi:hypothetical protein
MCHLEAHETRRCTSSSHGVEGGLQEMDGSVVGIDDELAVEPVRVFVSADQKLQGELLRGCDRRRLGDRDRRESGERRSVR